VSDLAPAAGAAPTQERIAAWRALSGLFLDAALDDRDIAAIARELRQTGYPPDELERIYEEEVAPACWKNQLALPGGAWNGFDPEWVVAAVQQHWQKSGGLQPRSLWRRLQIRRRTELTRGDWRRVRVLLEAGNAPES
jgi:hypothetical protein